MTRTTRPDLEVLEARVCLEAPAPPYNVWRPAGKDLLWSNPTNWTFGTVPTAADTVLLDGEAPATDQDVILDVPVKIARIATIDGYDHTVTFKGVKLYAAQGFDLGREGSKPTLKFEGEGCQLRADANASYLGDFTINGEGLVAVVGGSLTTSGAGTDHCWASFVIGLGATWNVEQGGTILFHPGGDIYNLGTIIIDGEVDRPLSSDNSTLINAGSILYVGGGSQTDIGMALWNRLGSLYVAYGALAFTQAAEDTEGVSVWNDGGRITLVHYGELGAAKGYWQTGGYLLTEDNTPCAVDVKAGGATIEAGYLALGDSDPSQYGKLTFTFGDGEEGLTLDGVEFVAKINGTKSEECDRLTSSTWINIEGGALTVWPTGFVQAQDSSWTILVAQGGGALDDFKHVDLPGWPVAVHKRLGDLAKGLYTVYTDQVVPLRPIGGGWGKGLDGLGL